MAQAAVNHKKHFRLARADLKVIVFVSKHPVAIPSMGDAKSLMAIGYLPFLNVK